MASEVWGQRTVCHAPVSPAGARAARVLGKIGLEQNPIFVGDFDVLELGLGVPGCHADAAGWRRWRWSGLVGLLFGDVNRKFGVAEILGEHLLSVIGCRSEAADRVVSDQIRAPLAGVDVHVDEQRGVTIHDDDVGVSFQACKPRGIGQCRAKVGRGSAFGGGPFADENFGAVAIGLIVMMNIPFHGAG